MVFALSGSWHHLYWNVYSRDDPGFFDLPLPIPMVLEGRVAESPKYFAAMPPEPGRLFQPVDRTQFVLRVTRLRNGKVWQNVNGLIMVDVSGNLSEIRYGDQLQIVGEISKPTPSLNPGDWNQKEYLRQSRILALFRGKSPESVTLLKSGKPSPGRFLESLRRQSYVNLQRYIGLRNSEFAAAMILGIRENVDPDLRQTLTESGTAHILAISGIHVGLIALGFHWFFQRLGLKRRSLAVALAGSMIFYLLLTDIRPSAIRATVLVLVASLAIYRGQPKLTVNSLAATAIIVLILNPTSLFLLGAQLSFLATGVFVWLTPFSRNPIDFLQKRFQKTKSLERQLEMSEEEWTPLENTIFGVVKLIAWQTTRYFVNTVINGALVSLVIWLIAIPVILSHFHLFAPIAVFVNPFLWLPLMFSLLSSLAVILTAPICSPLAMFFGFFADLFHTILSGMIGWFHNWPWAYFWLPGPRVWWLIVFYYPFIFWTLFPKHRPKWTKIMAFVLIWCMIGYGVSLVKQWNDLRNDRLTVRVLAVGHGLAVHLHTPKGMTVFYDLGCLSSPSKAARIAANSIWDTGATHVDAVFLSHPDSDHYNGLVHLMDKIPVHRFYVTHNMFGKNDQGVDLIQEMIHKRNIKVEFLEQGQTLEIPGFPEIRVLHPPGPGKSGFPTGNDSNATSLVLAIEHRGHKILLTGDVEAKRLSFLETPPEKFDLILSPHHGSLKPSAKKLAEWAKPNHVIVSGGLFTYREETEDYYRGIGCGFYRTFNDGMIEIIIDRTGFRVKPYLDHQ